MANYEINGEKYENVAGATLLDDSGNAVLFRPASSVGVEGITEIKTGTFTVTSETVGGGAGSVFAIPQAHGLTGIPDGWHVAPETWDGTMGIALAVSSWARSSDSYAGGGLRDVDAGTNHFAGTIGSAGLADETYIYPQAPAYGKFLPGVTYRWIAWRREATA